MVSLPGQVSTSFPPYVPTKPLLLTLLTFPVKERTDGETEFFGLGFRFPGDFPLPDVL